MEHNVNRFYVKNGVICRLLDETPAEYLVETEADLNAIAGVALPGSKAYFPNHDREFELSPSGKWVEKGDNASGEAEGFTVTAVAGTETLFGHTVSDLQTNLSILGDKITGTLKYVSTGSLATTWGAGNFMALQFGGGAFDKAKHILVGLDPSVSSGLVDVLKDPDKNGVFKVTDKANQKFKVIVDYGGYRKTLVFDLSGLTLNAN